MLIFCWIKPEKDLTELDIAIVQLRQHAYPFRNASLCVQTNVRVIARNSHPMMDMPRQASSNRLVHAYTLKPSPHQMDAGMQPSKNLSLPVARRYGTLHEIQQGLRRCTVDVRTTSCLAFRKVFEAL